MYVFFDPIDGSIQYTAIGTNDLVTDKENWIEVAEQDLADLSGWKVEGGQLVFFNIEPKRLQALKQIEDMIRRARSVIVTDLPGQDMIYLRKEREAIDFLNAIEPDVLNYQMINAEIGITGQSGYEIAQVWLNMSAIWGFVASSFEKIRLGSMMQIQNATTVEELDTILGTAAQHLAMFGG